MEMHEIPLTLLDPDGGWVNAPIHVSQTHGRPVLLHFWSMDCERCVEQLAQVREWIEGYGRQGLIVIGVDVTHSDAELRDTNRVESFARRHGMGWPIAVDDGSMAQAYEVDKHPAVLLFDAYGHLRLHADEREGLREVRPLLDRLTGPDATTGAFAP
ncbi:redoxin domain-containing protein [Myxococcaceae bacterium GXIMD 01537]